jgi:hypothetical protein
MTLPDYIKQVGDEKAAEVFGVSPRTAMSWRLRDRFPRPQQARKIIASSPVTMEGIYSNGIEKRFLTDAA